MILPPKRPRPAKPTPLEILLADPVYKEIPITILQHGQVLPLGVMVRGTMQWLLDKQMLETLFQQHAPDQYTRELTMDALVNLFIQVSTGRAPRSMQHTKPIKQPTSPPLTRLTKPCTASWDGCNPPSARPWCVIVRTGVDNFWLRT